MGGFFSRTQIHEIPQPKGNETRATQEPRTTSNPTKEKPNQQISDGKLSKSVLTASATVLNRGGSRTSTPDGSKERQSIFEVQLNGKLEPEKQKQLKSIFEQTAAISFSKDEIPSMVSATSTEAIPTISGEDAMKIIRQWFTESQESLNQWELKSGNKPSSEDTLNWSQFEKLFQQVFLFIELHRKK